MLLSGVKNVGRSVRDLGYLFADEIVYGDMAHGLHESIQYGLKLAESDLSNIMIAKILGRQVFEIIASTEPGRRIELAWHILNGRPVAYRITTTVPHAILLDDQTYVADCRVFEPIRIKTEPV